MTPNTQKRLLSSMLSTIILIGISLVFSVMTLVITVLQPVFVIAAQWNDLSWFVIHACKTTLMGKRSFVTWPLKIGIESAWSLVLKTLGPSFFIFSVVLLTNTPHKENLKFDSKQYCASIFIDLAKAFDTVDHSILVGRLRSIDVSEGSLAWFANDLSQRVQCI